MCHLIKKCISLILVLSICSTLVGVNVVFAADAEELRYDFDDGLSGAAAGSETTASALAIDGECVLTTKNTNLTAKNIRLKLPEINFGDGGYYMYAKVKYELPSGIQIESVKCMDVNTKLEYGIVSGSWNGYETKKLDLTQLKGKKTLSLTFTAGKVDVSGVGKVYIDWIVLTKSPISPDAEATDAGTQYVEMFKNSNSSAVRLLVSLGIMNYDKDANSFWNDSPMKRVQIAELLCKLYGLEAVKDSTPKFSDVKFEDRAVVETVVRNGYMSGCGEDKFEPDEYITGYQLITVFVTMLGGKAAAEAIGGFPDGYYKIGQRLGLRFSRMGSLNGNATRMDVANIIYDAMHSEYLLVDGIAGNNVMYETREGYTFLSEVLGIYRIEGILSSDNATSITQPGGQGQNRIVIGDAIIEDPRKISDGYLGYDVIAYEKRNDDDLPGELIYIEESKNNEVIKIDSINTTLEDVNNQEVTYYVDDKLKSIDISYAMDMIYNGVAENYSEELLEAKTNDEIQFIDNDGDGKFNLVIVYDYQDYMTNVSRAEQKEISLQYGEKTLRLDDCILRVYNKGIPSDIATIVNNQIISVATSRNKTGDVVYTIKTGFGTVEGAVESKGEEDGKTIFTINGKEYRLSDSYENLVAKGKIKPIDLSDEAIFYCNGNGEIVTYEAKTSKESLACLIGYHISTERLSPTLTVMLYTEDKKLEIFTAEDKVRINNSKRTIDSIESDPALTSKFAMKQLVKYTVSGDVLKSLTFAKDGYDITEFSKDVTHRWMKGTRTSVLCERDENNEYTLERYRVNQNTIVFKIPLGGSSNQLSNRNIIEDESLYAIMNGTFFGANNSGKIELYDVQEDGTVGYVLWTYGASERSVASGSKIGVISGRGKALNKDDDVVDKLWFYDESGTEVSMCTKSDVIYWIYNQEKDVYETTDGTLIENGDIIQYTADKNGEISQVLLRRNSSTQQQVAVVSSETKATTDLLINARVAFKTNDQFTVYTTEERPSSPMEVSGIVSNTGSAVYLYDSDYKQIYPIYFDQIELDDQVVAIIDGSNKTRILVVYR